MKTMDIEKVLIWAYREELPKWPREGSPGGVAAAWRSVTRFGELLELVDEEGLNRYGVLPDPVALTWPHPDAIAIHNAVVDLDQLDLAMPDGWDPLSDCGMGDESAAASARGLARLYHVDRSGRPRLRQMPRLLVLRCAILGPPDWKGEKPVKRVVQEYGRPKWFRRTVIVVDGQTIEIEADGFDHRRRRPFPDAYKKHVWEPDPAGLALDRALYEVWRASLDVLVEELAGKLAEITATTSGRPYRPWETGAGGPSVLQDLTAPVPQAANRRRVIAARKRV